MKEELKKLIIELIARGGFTVEALKAVESIVKKVTTTEDIYSEALEFNEEAVEFSAMEKKVLLELLYSKRDWQLAQKNMCDTLIADLSSTPEVVAEEETRS